MRDEDYPNQGPVDQLEDRHLGMVEVPGSNPGRSINPKINFKNLKNFPKCAGIS